MQKHWLWRPRGHPDVLLGQLAPICIIIDSCEKCDANDATNGASANAHSCGGANEVRWNGETKSRDWIAVSYGLEWCSCVDVLGMVVVTAVPRPNIVVNANVRFSLSVLMSAIRSRAGVNKVCLKTGGWSIYLWTVHKWIVPRQGSLGMIL